MPFTWQVLCSVVFSYQWQEAANFDTIQCCITVTAGGMRGDTILVMLWWVLDPCLFPWNVKSQTQQQQQSKENKDDMLPRPCHNRALVFIVLYIVGGVVTEIYCGNICLFSEIIWGETHLSNHWSRKQNIFGISVPVVLISSGMWFCPLANSVLATYNLPFFTLYFLLTSFWSLSHFWFSLIWEQVSHRGGGGGAVGARRSKWKDMLHPALLILFTVSGHLTLGFG